MLTTTLIHPPLLAALARAGHGSKILLADGNFPHGTGAAPAAERIYLNLTPGVLDVDQVLAAVMTAVVIEAAQVMTPPDGAEVAAIAGYRAALHGVTFTGHDRSAFYEQARHPDVAVVVATADERVYANLLLTIGVRTPPDSAPRAAAET